MIITITSLNTIVAIGHYLTIMNHHVGNYNLQLTNLANII